MRNACQLFSPCLLSCNNYGWACMTACGTFIAHQLWKVFSVGLNMLRGKLCSHLLICVPTEKSDQRWKVPSWYSHGLVIVAWCEPGWVAKGSGDSRSDWPLGGRVRRDIPERS